MSSMRRSGLHGAVVDVAEELVARHDGGAAGVARVEPRPLAAAVARGEVLPARGDQMGVEIDAHYFRLGLADELDHRGDALGVAVPEGP